MELTDETRMMEISQRPEPQRAKDPRPYAAVLAKQRKLSLLGEAAGAGEDGEVLLFVPPFAVAEFLDRRAGYSPGGAAGGGVGGPGDPAGAGGGSRRWLDPELGLWAPPTARAVKVRGGGGRGGGVTEGRTMAELRELAEQGKLAWGCSLFRVEDSLWLPLRRVSGMGGEDRILIGRIGCKGNGP